MQGLATVAAVAAGAVIAGGQTVQAVFADPAEELGPLMPVAETSLLQNAQTAEFSGAIGGDQMIPAGVGLAELNDQVDVQNLAKAVDIGKELAQDAKIIQNALADGAAEAHLYDGRAYVRMTRGQFTSGFGSRWGRSHQGIDISAPIGTPIYSLTDGVVEEAGPASGFGMWVVVRHPDGTKSVYGHVNRMFVGEGDKVRAGEKIAEVGNRGFSTGPHLHFEIWTADESKLNPVPYLRKRGIDL